MSKQVEDPMVYRVGIVRQDLGPEPLYVFDSMEIKEARSLRYKLDKEWEESATGKRPFRLDELDRSFAPSLILEIRIDTIPYTQFQRLNSPYEKQMREVGTSAFMHQNFNGR